MGLYQRERLGRAGIGHRVQRLPYQICRDADEEEHDRPPLDPDDGAGARPRIVFIHVRPLLTCQAERPFCTSSTGEILYLQRDSAPEPIERACPGTYLPVP